MSAGVARDGAASVVARHGSASLVARSGGGDPATPVILLVHGFGSDHARTWRDSGWLAALDAAGRSWIAVDLPGHGTAPRPHDSSAYTTTALVAALAEVADDVGPVDLVGYSLGGELALRLAGTRPDRVRRLVVGGVGLASPIVPGSAAAIADGDATAPVAALWAAATAVAGHDPAALLACVEGLEAGLGTDGGRTAFPGPALLFAGAEDRLSAGMETLAAELPQARALRLERRRHHTALTSSALRRAMLDHLAP